MGIVSDTYNLRQIIPYWRPQHLSNETINHRDVCNTQRSALIQPLFYLAELVRTDVQQLQVLMTLADMHQQNSGAAVWPTAGSSLYSV